MHGICFIFKNNLNGFWDFYHVPMWVLGSSMAIATMAKTKNPIFLKNYLKIISKECNINETTKMSKYYSL
jgi:hypothetical protein